MENLFQQQDQGTIIIGNDIFKINIKTIMTNLCDDVPAVDFMYVLKKTGVTYVLALMSDFTYRLYSAFPIRHFSKGTVSSLIIDEKLDESHVVRFNGNVIESAGRKSRTPH